MRGAMCTVGVGLALTCVGCIEGGATGAASKPAVVFPSREEIAAIPARTPRPEAFGSDEAPVDAWSFEAQGSTEAAAYDDPSAWGDLMRALVAGHEANVTPSAPLKCAAHELARFHARSAALPTESLRRFIAARCGAVTTALAPFYTSFTSAEPVPDEQVLPKIRENLARLLASSLGAQHVRIGLAMAREGQRTTVVALLSRDDARLEPGGLGVDASRHVTIRGQARGDYDAIGALANRGEVGTGPCKSDPEVKPPRFAVSCELAPGDPFAWVEIVAHRRGEILLHELAEGIIHEGDGSALTYVAHRAGHPSPVATGPDLSRALVDGINQVRAGANMAKLALAPKQSAENTRLAGTLLDAAFGGDDAASNRAALGLLAGWEVPGLIRDGGFFLGAVRTNDSNAWLDYALERPMGRLSLLDPNARLIAVGPSLPAGGGALGAVVTTFSLFGSEDHSADASQFFARVAAARAARGLPAPVRVQGLGEMDAELAQIAKAGVAPSDALRATMKIAVERTGRGVQGYTLETNDLERTDVPEALLAPGPLELMVGITHHRAEGAAWGQYVIVVVVLR